MTKHIIEPSTSCKITVIMTNDGDTKMTRTYKSAERAAEHYADYSTLNWEYGMKRKDIDYEHENDRYHRYCARLYRRVLPIFKQFLK